MCARRSGRSRKTPTCPGSFFNGREIRAAATAGEPGRGRSRRRSHLPMPRTPVLATDGSDTMQTRSGIQGLISARQASETVSIFLSDSGNMRKNSPPGVICARRSIAYSPIGTRLGRFGRRILTTRRTPAGAVKRLPLTVADTRPFLSRYVSILTQIRRPSSGPQFARSSRNPDAGLTPVTNIDAERPPGKRLFGRSVGRGWR